jgi:Zn-finger nucleic acid-binding protein
MKQVEEPDLVTDVCTACGGMCLDKGELNELATGHAGDIEYCSIDRDAHPDKFPIRLCPKCPGQTMSKINLLAYSELVFDFCPKCDGLFLDKGEIAQMNSELQEVSPDGSAQEYRGYRDGHLVRVNQLQGVDLGPDPRTAGTTVRTVEVDTFEAVLYFKQPLKVGLRVFHEKWRDGFLKALGLFKKQDIQTGDKAFDGQFIIQSEAPDKANRLLNPEVRREILSFVSAKHRIYSEPGSLELTDKGLLYKEGPYAARQLKINLEGEAGNVIGGLLKIATAIEKGDPA